MSDNVVEWVPEFDGQRPPFEPGNQLAVTHGAYSPRVVEPLAQTFVDLVLAEPQASYAQAPVFRPALWAWAYAEAQAQLLREHLGSEVGDLNDEARSRAYLLLHRVETRAQTCRARLGLDPLSRVRLGKDLAQGQAAADMSTLMAQLAAAEKAREEQGS